jgi:hypothetical protein
MNWSWIYAGGNRVLCSHFVEPKVKAAEKKEPSGALMKTEKSNIIYKFQDGSTNSVKRKVFIKDFLWLFQKDHDDSVD